MIQRALSGDGRQIRRDDDAPNEHVADCASDEGSSTKKSTFRHVQGEEKKCFPSDTERNGSKAAAGSYLV